MSHDTEAAYASAEIATLMQANQNQFFMGIGTPGAWSLFAGREGQWRWPLADGVIQASNPNRRKPFKIAFEFKRQNEGVHGILTALGQSYAYLEKGYDASVMAIPKQYSSHNAPGDHVKRIIDATAPDIPIWIYTYDAPNLSTTRPFQNKLTCVRAIDLGHCRQIVRTSTANLSGRVSTLWAHMREGMSHPDAFYRFCQSAKIITSIGENLSSNIFPADLVNAVNRVSPGADIFKFLSNTSGDSVLDKAWRRVWFNYYFWKDLIPIFNGNSPYSVNSTKTKIRIDDNGSNTQYQQLFSGRVDSIKEVLVGKLNNGTINEPTAWEEYAQKVRKDAHSYREVIDSGLYHIGFISADGNLTDLGYKFVDACERTDSAYSSLPFSILRASLLQNGQYSALLHYIYKLSEDRFDNNFYDFTALQPNGSRQFNHKAYLAWLMGEFDNTLHLVQKSTTRAGGTRNPFQAELLFMKKYGLIRQSANGAPIYKIGSGLCIDWPQIQNSVQFFNTL